MKSNLSSQHCNQTLLYQTEENNNTPHRLKFTVIKKKTNNQYCISQTHVIPQNPNLMVVNGVTFIKN